MFSDDYIVLLHCCSKGDPDGWISIPINHVYKLKEDFKSYSIYIHKDIDGVENGWRFLRGEGEVEARYFAEFNHLSSLCIRKATEEEIDRYMKNNNSPVETKKDTLFMRKKDLYIPNKSHKNKINI